MSDEAPPFVPGDGFRVFHRGELTASWWCVDCAASRCSCAVDAQAFARTFRKPGPLAVKSGAHVMSARRAFTGTVEAEIPAPAESHTTNDCEDESERESA